MLPQACCATLAGKVAAPMRLLKVLVVVAAAAAELRRAPLPVESMRLMSLVRS